MEVMGIFETGLFRQWKDSGDRRKNWKQHYGLGDVRESEMGHKEINLVKGVFNLVKKFNRKQDKEKQVKRNDDWSLSSYIVTVFPMWFFFSEYRRLWNSEMAFHLTSRSSVDKNIITICDVLAGITYIQWLSDAMNNADKVKNQALVP